MVHIEVCVLGLPFRAFAFALILFPNGIADGLVRAGERRVLEVGARRPQLLVLRGAQLIQQTQRSGLVERLLASVYSDHRGNHERRNLNACIFYFQDLYCGKLLRINCFCGHLHRCVRRVRLLCRASLLLPDELAESRVRGVCELAGHDGEALELAAQSTEQLCGAEQKVDALESNVLTPPNLLQGKRI